MIYRIYPSKDTFITNDFTPAAVRGTGSNVGFAEELVVFKRAGVSGAIGDRATGSLARSLIQFDLSMYGELTASGEIMGSSARYILRMNHKTSAETLPYGYNMVLHRVSSSWDEGRGMDVELGDAGVSNWIKRSSTQYWTQPGGDVIPSLSATIHFDSGFEDIESDISDIVGSWLTGTIPNNGLMLRMASEIESESNYSDFSVKKFYSRQTDFGDRGPYLEVRIDDFTADDRSNMRWGRTGSLFIYNIVDGIMQDLPSLPIATISDASGTLVGVTGSRMGTGLYSASFTLQTGSYSGSLFYDSWRVGAQTLVTGRFTLQQPEITTTLSGKPLVAVMRDLRDEYSPEELVRFSVLFRRRSQTAHVRTTASLDQSPYIVEKAFYAIENEATRERVIPFGTGSLQHTRLSYDGDGNYFKMHMTNLHQGNVYRVIFLVYDNGRRVLIDPGARFKVI